jgi:hypothetical protein
MGIENGNAFVEINTSTSLKGDYVETVTTPLDYQLGWNMIGVYCSGSTTEIFNVMPDGTTDSVTTVHTNAVFTGRF